MKRYFDIGNAPADVLRSAARMYGNNGGFTRAAGVVNHVTQDHLRRLDLGEDYRGPSGKPLKPFVDSAADVLSDPDGRTRFAFKLGSHEMMKRYGGFDNPLVRTLIDAESDGQGGVSYRGVTVDAERLAESILGTEDLRKPLGVRAVEVPLASVDLFRGLIRYPTVVSHAESLNGNITDIADHERFDHQLYVDEVMDALVRKAE